MKSKKHKKHSCVLHDIGLLLQKATELQTAMKIPFKIAPLQQSRDVALFNSLLPIFSENSNSNSTSISNSISISDEVEIINLSSASSQHLFIA